MPANPLPLIAARIPNHEKLNVSLRETLMIMSETVPDKGSNLASGQSYFDKKWLSNAELHKNQDSSLRSIVSFAEKTANREAQKTDPGLVVSTASMWCIVSKPGLAGKRHRHAGIVSGAYYVDTGVSGAEHGGLLQFYLNPQSTQPTHVIEPVSGGLYLFPSTLEHSVSRYDGAAPRIVIALNLS